jgi:hypothetical protein
MTPIRSALKTGPPRSKGYRLQTCQHRQSALYGLTAFSVTRRTREIGIRSCARAAGMGWLPGGSVR